MTARPKLIDPEELAGLLTRGETIVLLDVREPEETAICFIPGATRIPMREIPDRLGDLDRAHPTIVYCHHGQRSHMVASFLLEQGFEDVANLAGGIDGYAARVDPDMARY